MQRRKPARNVQDLLVWQKAHQIVLLVYSVTANFPSTETFGLVSQVRRAAVSVPANLAEGFKRRSPADKARFVNIAQGSLEEVKYYLDLARDLGYLKDSAPAREIEETSKMLEASWKALTQSENRAS